MGSSTAAWQSPALGAVTSLVLLQVGYGVGYKALGLDGKPMQSFSPPAYIFIAESIKLFMSALLYIRQWLLRANPRFHEHGYLSLDDSSDDITVLPVKRRSISTLLRGLVNGEGRVLGFVQLAMLYALINNDTFTLFRIAEPATVQLFNSGVVLATALTVVVGLGIGFQEVQWYAIVTQLCGVILSQVGTEQGSAYPVPVFLFVLIYGCLSAFAGVYHQKLNQSSDASLHADNMILFSAGACINLAIHLTLGWRNPERPGLLDIFDDPAALMLVWISAFIGLATSSVYKYADAVTKCFATSVSGGILLLISRQFFGSRTEIWNICGAIVIFLATGIYFTAPEEGDPDWVPAPQDKELWGEGKGGVQEGRYGRWAGGTGLLAWFGLAIRSMAAIAIVVTTSNTNSPKLLVDLSAISRLPSSQPDILRSPFDKTLAFVSWNYDRREYIPMVETYRPFFYDIHYSTSSATGDGLDLYIYKQVADTMQLILDQQPEISGLLYYQSDSWIDPTRFGDMDFKNIWFPDSMQPRFVCTERVESLPWIFDGRSDARRAKVAAKILQGRGSGYEVNIDQFCDGSSDIYYIPRRFFKDFIYLSSIFNDLKVFHEIAIPTMATIIDNTYRTAMIGDSSQISPLDCWSNGGSSGPTRHDAASKRCGHKLDYSDRDVTQAFYDRLAQSARWLGTKGPKESEVEEERKCTWATNPWRSGWICPDTLLNEPIAEGRPLLGADSRGDFSPRLIQQKIRISF